MSRVLGVSSAAEQQFTVITLGKVFLLQVVGKVHSFSQTKIKKKILKLKHLYTQSCYRAATLFICLLLSCSIFLLSARKVGGVETKWEVVER